MRWIEWLRWQFWERVERFAWRWCYRHGGSSDLDADLTDDEHWAIGIHLIAAEHELRWRFWNWGEDREPWQWIDLSDEILGRGR